MFAPKNLPLICAVLGTLTAIVSGGDSPRSDDAAQSCSEVLQGPSSESQTFAAPGTTLRRHQANGDVKEHVMICRQEQTASAMARAKAKDGKASVDVTVSAKSESGGASASSRAVSQATSR